MQTLPASQLPAALNTELEDTPELLVLALRVQGLMLNQLAKALEILQESRLHPLLHSKPQARAYFQLWIADCHFFLYQIQALQEYDRALEAADHCQNLEIKTNALHGLARVFTRFGDSNSGMEYGQQALAHAQQQQQTDLVPGILLSIALVMGINHQHERCAELCWEALALSQATGSKSHQLRAMNNVADSMISQYESQMETRQEPNQRLISEAVRVGTEALVLAQELKLVLNELYVRETLAHALELDGDVDAALTCLEEGTQSLSGYGYVAEELDIKVRAAALMLRVNRVEDAIAMLNEARGEALKLASYTYFDDLLRMLSTAYEISGDYQAALRAYKEFHLVMLKRRDQRTEISAKLFSAKRDIARAQSEAELQKNIVHQLEDSNRNLRVQANQDPLTGLPNRRALEHDVEERFERNNNTATFVMCDLDKFKQINDRFTHLVGDDVLRCIASLIRSNLRSDDFAARIGGEEFALILEHSKDSLEACERIRKSIENFDWSSLVSGLEVTMSFGYTIVQSGDSLKNLMARADAALYQAKHTGRNRVCAA